MTRLIKKVPRQIAYRLILATVLFSTVITLLTSAYQLYGDYLSDINQIEIRMNEIQSIHLVDIAKRVWVSDQTEIQYQLENLLKIPRLNYLEVQEGGKVKGSAGARLSDDKIERTYDILYNHRGRELKIGILLVQASLKEVYQHLIDHALTIIISNAIKTFLVTGFIFLLFEFLITRHLHTISDFAMNLDLSNLGEKLHLNRKSNQKDSADELDVVVEAFDVMQNNLKVSVDKLHERDAYIHLINDSIAAAVLGVDSDGKCSFVNRIGQEMLGYSESELIGKDLHALLHEKQLCVDSHDTSCELQKVLRPGSTEFQEYWHKDQDILSRKDGSKLYAECWVHQILNSQQKAEAILSFIDVSERYTAQQELAMYQGHLEKLVSERTAELQQMYAELESFSYSVSHDLRTPLRAINGFSQILQEDKAEQLDEEGREFLQKISQAAEKMGELIDSLLALSRISRNELNLRQVDISQMARKYLAIQKKNAIQKTIISTIEDDIIVKADEKLMQVVMEHLCSNAVKFSSQEASVQICIGQTRDSESVTVFIRDNGAGFDMAHAERLFKPFQRLHDAALYTGHGIGLATVAKILKRHNGKVWAESPTEKGATFYFSLPA